MHNMANSRCLGRRRSFTTWLAANFAIRLFAPQEAHNFSHSNFLPATSKHLRPRDTRITSRRSTRTVCSVYSVLSSVPRPISACVPAH